MKAWRAPWGVSIISRVPRAVDPVLPLLDGGLDCYRETQLIRRGDRLVRTAHPPERQHLDAEEAQQRHELLVVEDVLALVLATIDERPRSLHVDPGGPDGLAGRSGAPAGVTHRTSERRGDGPLRRRVAGHRPAGRHTVAIQGPQTRRASPRSAPRNVVTTGLPNPATASRSAWACAVPDIARSGTNTTTSASTSSDRPAAPTAAASRPSGLTVVPASTGSPASTRSSPSSASTTSRLSAAVELPTTATRPPAGRGW